MAVGVDDNDLIADAIAGRDEDFPRVTAGGSKR